jgi:hypothetical protein
MANSISFQTGGTTRKKIHDTVVGGIIELRKAKDELGGVDKTPKKANKPELAARLNEKGNQLLRFSQEIKNVAQSTSKDLGRQGVKEYLGRSKAAEILEKLY